MKILVHFTSFLIFLPTILGVILFRKLKVEFKVLIAYLVIFSLLEIVMSLSTGSNLYLIHFFIPIEMILLSWIFHLNLKEWLPNNLIPGIILIFVIGSILNSIFIQPLSEFNSNALYTQAIIIISYSLLYLYKVFTDLKIEKLTQEGMFWLSIAVLVYFSGTMFLYLSINYLMEKISRDSLIFLYSLIQSVCHFIEYSLFTIAIWKGQKWKKT